jgi:hypothetical protein
LECRGRLLLTHRLLLSTYVTPTSKERKIRKNSNVEVMTSLCAATVALSPPHTLDIP